MISEMISWIYLFKAEWIRLCAEYKYFRANYILTHINFSLLLSGLFLMHSTRNLAVTPLSTLNFLFYVFVWYLSFGVIQSFVAYISEEFHTGSIYQILMSKSGYLGVLLARQFLNFLISLGFLTVMCAVLVGLFGQPLDIQVVLDNSVLFCFLLFINLIGVAGIALGIASLAFRFKRILSAANIVNYVLLFFTGGMVPLDKLPKSVALVACLLPSTQANLLFASGSHFSLDGGSVLVNQVGFRGVTEQFSGSVMIFVLCFVWNVVLLVAGIFCFRKASRATMM